MRRVMNGILKIRDRLPQSEPIGDSRGAFSPLFGVQFFSDKRKQVAALCRRLKNVSDRLQASVNQLRIEDVLGKGRRDAQYHMRSVLPANESHRSRSCREKGTHALTVYPGILQIHHILPLHICSLIISTST
jgi:hypothetical protein